MRAGLVHFVCDVERNAPVAVVVVATAICIPSLSAFFERHLSLFTMLERYGFALLLSMVGIEVLSRLVVRYAFENAAQLEESSDEVVTAAAENGARQ